MQNFASPMRGASLFCKTFSDLELFGSKQISGEIH